MNLTVVDSTNITSTGGCYNTAGSLAWQDRDQFRYYRAHPVTQRDSQ